MKTILYMAISIDGKITTSNGDTSWVESPDIERMDSQMIKCRAMMMGSKTYKSFGDDLPNDKALQVIITNDSKLLSLNIHNVLFTNKPLVEVLNQLKSKGFESILLAGGGELNTSMINLDLIDEIRLIVKPIVLGKGKMLFNEVNGIKRFKFIKSENLTNGAIELSFEKVINH